MELSHTNAKKSLLIASLVVLAVGAAVAGAATLAGGAETVYLPDFLRAVIG